MEFLAQHASTAGDGGYFPASKYNEATSHLAQYQDSGSNIKTGDQVETKYKLVKLSNCWSLPMYWYFFQLKSQYQLSINYRDHTSGLHWDNEKGTNIITDRDKKVFESYLVGTFGTDVAKVCCFHELIILIWLATAYTEQAKEKIHF